MQPVTSINRKISNPRHLLLSSEGLLNRATPNIQLHVNW